MTFYDDFKMGLDPAWNTYNTKWNPTQPHKAMAADHTTVDDGIMTLRVDRKPDGHWYGADCVLTIPFTYGVLETMIRIDAGVGTKCANSIWPADKVWPPEIDWYEIPSGDRQFVTQTLHIPPSNQMIHRRFDLDCTQWHYFQVEWAPGYLLFDSDSGGSSIVSPDVPSRPMKVHFRIAPSKGMVPAAPARMQVDWVRLSY